MIDVTVLIVGAGPTGLLLAAELCRRGIACRVIDENTDFNDMHSRSRIA